MKGTKLWQSTGSPLISGRSRRLRPFWQPWLMGSLAAVAVAAVMLFMLLPESVVPVVSIGMILGSLAGAAAGVWLARLAGWNGSWLVGAAGGLVVAAAAFAVMALPVFSALGRAGS